MDKILAKLGWWCIKHSSDVECVGFKSKVWSVYGDDGLILVYRKNNDIKDTKQFVTTLPLE